MMLLSRLQQRLPQEQDAELLLSILSDAAAFICAYTGRSSVPVELESALLRLAVIYYDRIGMEGELIREEGGVVRRLETLPEDIAAMLKSFRLARTVS